MIRPMKLKGRIVLNDDATMTFRSTLYDGTQFSLTVTEHDIQKNVSFRHDRRTVDGWLYVQQESQQDTRVYLTLPKPTVEFGKQILVNEVQLMPRQSSAADFGAKKKKAPKKKAGVVDEETIQNVVNDAMNKAASTNS